MKDQRLWYLFKASRNPTKVTKYRNLLSERYLPMVHDISNKVSASLPPGTLLDDGDLAAVGFLGLVQAIDKFEPSRGHQFSTYAYSRIRGAMQDEMRSLDWVPHRSRLKLQDGEEPSFETLEESNEVLGTEEEPWIPHQAVDLERLIARQLTEEEREVIVLKYYRHLSLRKVAAQMGVKPGRAVLLHRRAKNVLKASLMGREAEFQLAV